MTEAYGEDWESLFYGFEFKAHCLPPLLVRCTAPSPRMVAILFLKVQYPGVSDSIDNDVDNISTVLRFVGPGSRGYRP